MLAEHCREVGRDVSEIVTTRLGTLIVAPTREEAERRKDAWQREKGVDDAGLAMRLIWGDPDMVGDGVQRFFDAGLDGMLFNMPVGSTPADVAFAGRTLIERFGPAS